MSVYAVLDAGGRVTARGKVPTDRAGLTAWLREFPPARVVLEVSTHSPWISRLITELGHTPIVANARKVKAVSSAARKSDTVDAETLARLGRVDTVHFGPVSQRGVEAQIDRAQRGSRDSRVRSRTQRIKHVRGSLK
jgi:transposase